MKKLIGMFLVCACTFSSSVQAQMDDPPEILLFQAVDVGGGYWQMSGFVIDENPGSCVVFFSGDVDGDATVDSTTGAFSISVQAGMGGIVEAIAFDEWFQESDPVFDTVGS